MPQQITTLVVVTPNPTWRRQRVVAQARGRGRVEAGRELPQGGVAEVLPQHRTARVAGAAHQPRVAYQGSTNRIANSQDQAIVIVAGLMISK